MLLHAKERGEEAANSSALCTQPVEGGCVTPQKGRGLVEGVMNRKEQRRPLIDKVRGSGAESPGIKGANPTRT